VREQLANGPKPGAAIEAAAEAAESELTLARDSERTRYQESAASGDVDIAVVYAGEGAGLVEDVPQAWEVVTRNRCRSRTCSPRGTVAYRIGFAPRSPWQQRAHQLAASRMRLLPGRAGLHRRGGVVDKLWCAGKSLPAIDRTQYDGLGSRRRHPRKQTNRASR
jgi:hypothetical protein